MHEQCGKRPILMGAHSKVPPIAGIYERTRNLVPKYPILGSIYHLLRHVYTPVAPYVHVYLRGKTPILIYTMAKVGTMSVRHSLNTAFPNRRITNIHAFDTQNIEQMFPRSPAEHHPRIQRERHKQYARQALCWPIIRRYPRVKVITLVRDPIARNLSLFFWLFEAHTGVLLSEATSLTTEHLTRLFLGTVRHATPLHWFDRELYQTLSIDVFQYPFSHTHGYQHLRKNNVDLLILKAETSDALKQAAIASFIGKDDFQLFRSNTTAERSEGEIYRKLLHQIRLPLWYIDSLYSSRYMRHFYSAAEIAHFRRRWQGKIADA
jgi:hypothetical protein